MRATMVVLAVLLCLPSSSWAQAPGAVTGSVASTNRVLLPDADVALEGVGSTYTDSQGQFTFSNVSPGNYRLTVSKSGFPPFTRALSVRAGMTERVEVILAGFAEARTSQGESVAVPLMRSGNSFFVQAVLNGRRQALFVLDTGASITTISRGVAQELGISFGPGSPT
ncbi:MAG TPA: carboxypeptidase regulatory-like domain-containing protein, partial [Candidatus Sulfotelmatobacter sp.]|nr:carboxypeptidase regulatory-like domain-containing protein [Candidatus Sulfotelmatobacter sp.]